MEPSQKQELRLVVEEAVREALSHCHFEFIAMPQFGGELVMVNRRSVHLAQTGQEFYRPERPEPSIPSAPSERVLPPARVHGKLQPDMKLKDAGPIWIKTRKPFVATATYRRKQHNLNQLVKVFGDKTLAECADPDLIRDYQDARRVTAGGDCINHEMQLLAEILQRVGLWKAVADDYQPLPVKPSSIGRALSPDEEAKFVKAASEKEEWKVAYLVAVLAAHTLLSPSEIFQRQLQDINLAKQTINVPLGKNNFRVREVPLNKHALKSAKLLVSRAKELGSWRPEHFLLPYRPTNGKYDVTRPARGCRSAWRSLTRSIGLRGFRVKDMRHHGVTVLDENKVSTRVMKALAGHSPNSKVLNHYSHARMKAKQQAVKVLERRVKIA